MGRNKDCNAFLDGKVADHFNELIGALRIKASCRLIHNDDLGRFHQDIGNAESLTHTS